LREFDIQQYFSNKGPDSQTYIANLNFLHRTLIEPIANEIRSMNQLVIVPHGFLNYLPFEMLAPESSSNDYRALPYLIRSQSIQYAPSLAIWGKEKSTFQKYTDELIGFAPFSEENKTDLKAAPLLAQRSNLSELKFTGIELEQASKHFSGQTFFHQTATESEFLNSGKKSRILHLATHAIANDEDPMRSGLLFSTEIDSLEDGYLNAYEIYNMSLPAELAIISACDTGLGELAEGEGVISLGRAFSYAGCQSVLMSLWKANDQSTSNVMGTFYEEISNGLPKNQALRNAKLAYLSNSDPLMAHPYFWAGMVAVGDMSPIDSNPNTVLMYLMLGGIALLGVIWMMNKMNE